MAPTGKRQPKKAAQRDSWPQLIRKVSISLRRLHRGEVLTFLLFVLIAAFFWIVQTSREETMQDFTVNLYIEGQPQDMVFTTRVPTQLRVTLSDTNLRLFNYRYRRRLDQITVNFERYADAIGNFRVSAAELQSLLREDLKGTTRILAVNPSLLDARFAQTEGRKYPVVLTPPYQVAENYRLHPVVIQPDSVMVNAPTAVLDTLQFVVAHTTASGLLTDSVTEDLPLDLQLGVKATPSRVTVLVPVSQYVEKVFDAVELKTCHVPSDQRLIVFPYSVRLTCLVDMAYYRQLSAEDFEVVVDYDSIQPPTTPQACQAPIQFRYKGDALTVSHIDVSPKTAEYVVEPN